MMLHKNRFYISVTLNCIRNITGKDKLLLMHHGMLGSGKNLRPLLNESSLGSQIDTILIDSRNHGQSPHSQTHSAMDLADDLFVFIWEELMMNEERKWKQLILLGHSMGGIAVMQLTRLYPQLQDYISQVIIVDIPCNAGNYGTGWGQSAQYQMLRKASALNLNRPISQIFREIQQIAGDQDYANLLKFNVKILGNGKHKWKANINTVVDYYSELTNYSLSYTKWRNPVHLIYGSESTYFQEGQKQDFLNPYPHMKENEHFHRIQGARHWIHVDQKNQFVKTVEKIVKRGYEAI